MGQAIRELLNSYRLTSKFDEANLINSWERIAGKPIAKKTKTPARIQAMVPMSDPGTSCPAINA